MFVISIFTVRSWVFLLVSLYRYQCYVCACCVLLTIVQGHRDHEFLVSTGNGYWGGLLLAWVESPSLPLVLAGNLMYVGNSRDSIPPYLPCVWSTDGIVFGGCICYKGWGKEGLSGVSFAIIMHVGLCSTYSYLSSCALPLHEFSCSSKVVCCIFVRWVPWHRQSEQV